MLFLYAFTFSYAYASLDTGTGALILFGTVQLSLMLLGILKKQKSHFSEFIGVPLAFAGLVYLVLPELSTPSMMGVVLMIVAGLAWSLYSAAGANSDNALADTAFNFSLTIPFITILLGLMFTGHWVGLDTAPTTLTVQGLTLALASGTITSGLGYTFWYIAARGLSSVQAGICQLLVPLLASAGGVLFADEVFTERLILSSLFILGGVALSFFGKQLSVSIQKIST